MENYIGQIKESKNWGFYKLIFIFKEGNYIKYKIQFLDSGNIYIVNKKEFNNGYICDSIERENKIINSIFPQNCGDSLKVIKKSNKQYFDKSYLWECEFVKYPYKVLARIDEIIKGSILNPLIEQNEFIDHIYPQNCGDSLKVISKIDKKYKCKFLKYPCEVIAQKSHITRGGVNNPYIPSICFKGFLGNGKYSQSNNQHYYKIWSSLLKRCYEKNDNSFKSYGAKGVIVDSNWFDFQNFCDWYENNEKWNKEYYLELDKDILYNINHLETKIYSPETCLLIPSELNCFLAGDNVLSGISVKLDDNLNIKYNVSFIQKGIKYEYLNYSTFKEAKEVYAQEKYKIWKELIKNYNLPKELKEILLSYDFSWNFVVKNKINNVTE